LWRKSFIFNLGNSLSKKYKKFLKIEYKELLRAGTNLPPLLIIFIILIKKEKSILYNSPIKKTRSCTLKILKSDSMITFSNLNCDPGENFYC
jgi:hypothetical protein